jgi:hypothetical protein
MWVVAMKERGGGWSGEGRYAASAGPASRLEPVSAASVGVPFRSASEPVSAASAGVPFRSASEPVSVASHRNLSHRRPGVSRGRLARGLRSLSGSLPEAGRRSFAPSESLSGPGREPSMPAPSESAPSALIRLAQKVKEEGLDAVAETAADQIETVALDEAFSAWQASGEAPLGKSLQILSLADGVVHEEEIGEPVKLLLSTLDTPGSSLLSSIIENAPIDVIDRGVNAFRLVIELAGMAICLASGNPILGCACFKAFIHDEIHRTLVDGVKELINHCLFGSSEDGKSPVPDDHLTALDRLINPGREITHKSADDLAKPLADTNPAVAMTAQMAPDTVVGPHAYRSSAVLVKPMAETAMVQINPRNVVTEDAVTTTSRKPHCTPPTAKPASAEAAMPRTSTATPARNANTVTVRVSGGSPELRAGREAVTRPSAGLTRSAIAGQQAPAGLAEDLTFVRLRIYYDYAAEIRPVAGEVIAPLVRLKWLVVVRDSRRFHMLQSWKMTTGQAMEYIAGQLKSAASPRAWRLYSHPDDGEVTLSSESVAGLLDNLAQVLVGHSPPANISGLAIQDLPVTAVSPILGPESHCVEIIGFLIKDASGDVKLQCLASKAPVDDEFSRIVVSGLRR